MRKSYQEANLSGENSVAQDGRWMMGVPAIVADNIDPERQHRVRVIIPSIDEDEIYDIWVRQLIFCLGNKRGAAFIPPKNSEVVLFGQLGQKYNIFYASVYNEELFIPDEFNDENSVGIHAPGNLLFIAEQLAKLKGANVAVEAEQSASVTGNQINIEGGQITINADGSISINGGNVSIGGDVVKIHNRLVSKVGGTI